MNITFWLNGVKRQAEVRPDELLLDFLRKNSCYSVKRGCETANCGLCTVLMDERPVLSCSMLAARADGKRIVTLEGMQEEAKELHRTETVVKCVDNIIITFRAAALALPSKLSGLVVGETDIKKVEEIIKAEVYSMLNTLSEWELKDE